MMLYCYTRYIIRNLLTPLMLITLTLTGIAWLTQSLRFIDLIVNRGLSVYSFVYLSALLVPSLLSVILPVAMFCAVLFTYYKLVMDSEMIVFKSVGISRMGLAKPALILAGCITAFGYLVSLYLMPVSYREFKDMQAYIRDNYASMLLQEGVFNTPIKGLTVYIDKRKDDGMLEGLLVHDNRNLKAPVTMMAQEGRLLKTPAGPQFELINGNRQEVDADSHQLSLLYFERYTLDLAGFTQETEDRSRDPKERYLAELFFPDKKDEEIYDQLRAEGHQRLTWPLYNLMMTFIALSALLSGQFNRRGQWKRLCVGIAMAFMVITLGVSMANVVARHPNAILGMYGVIVVITAVSLYILTYQKKLKYQYTGPLVTQS